MKVGIKFKIELIADSRFLGNCRDLETLIAIQRDSLKTAISGEGIEIYRFGSQRYLKSEGWEDGESQIRQYVTLILNKPLTQNTGQVICEIQ